MENQTELDKIAAAFMAWPEGYRENLFALAQKHAKEMAAKDSECFGLRDRIEGLEAQLAAYREGFSDRALLEELEWRLKQR